MLPSIIHNIESNRHFRAPIFFGNPIDSVIYCDVIKHKLENCFSYISEAQQGGDFSMYEKQTKANILDIIASLGYKIIDHDIKEEKYYSDYVNINVHFNAKKTAKVPLTRHNDLLNQEDKEGETEIIGLYSDGNGNLYSLLWDRQNNEYSFIDKKSELTQIFVDYDKKRRAKKAYIHGYSVWGSTLEGVSIGVEENNGEFSIFIPEDCKEHMRKFNLDELSKDTLAYLENADILFDSPSMNNDSVFITYLNKDGYLVNKNGEYVNFDNEAVVLGIKISY